MSKTVTVNHIGFTGLLTLLFIGLKLTHYIDWPWLWVLSPSWLWLAFVLVAVALLLLVALVGHLFEGRSRRGRKR